ncbi:MAG: hypothetical protein SNJ77_01055 [Cytophagales bacterium]
MKKTYFLTAVACVSLFSCTKKEEIIQNLLPASGTYDNTNFAANTRNDSTLVANFAKLVSETQKGRPGSETAVSGGTRGQSLSASALFGYFDDNINGQKVSSIATDHYKSLVGNASSGYFKELETSSGRDWPASERVIPVPDDAKGGMFGGANGYLFNKFGVESEQVVDKAFFGSLYNKVFTDYLTNDKVTLANVDRALMLYGAPTTFPNGIPSVTQGRTLNDRFAAQYAARRDNSNGPNGAGFYTVIKQNFILLQNALKNNDKGQQELAIKNIRENWEKAIGATVINYLHSSKGKIGDESASVSAAAYHAFGEAIGFLEGFNGLSAPKIITDAQINEVLTIMKSRNISASNNPIAFENPTNINAFDNAINKLRDIYGFTPQQVEYFKSNDVNTRNKGYRFDIED